MTVTLEELERRTDEHARQLIDLNTRVTTVERDVAVDQATGQSISTRLAGIESNLTWLIRLIIGALILAVVGFALQGGFSSGV